MKKVLFILPHHDFYDEEYFNLREELEAQGFDVNVASTHSSEAQGRFRRIVVPDCLIESVTAGDYDVYVVIGGEGAKELYHHEILQTLIRNIVAERKQLVLFDEAVMVLYYTGIINNRRVTAPEHLKSDLEAGGAYFTAKEIEEDDVVITALDHKSVPHVAKSIVRLALGNFS